eukprot:CAMPEP_0177188456 /NCGR_PEP_ID=MMETSP0367-20130122/19739_1 /TAXON_ID=447022 ORGANISM="Scrippsiella hangoei-like, Strain SHHI-4" /NCGR_SAMPLE_ID=MMETSP0367 /ASSEMBLY_ACC=CAM_ASM_000362 /LENGTH=59 /DNA_ID=CAMNT_0018635917 /DNA_START=44 /DNA_END=223 /DNA_ORIENTATION=+
MRARGGEWCEPKVLVVRLSGTTPCTQEAANGENENMSAAKAIQGPSSMATPCAQEATMV